MGWVGNMLIPWRHWQADSTQGVGAYSSVPVKVTMTSPREKVGLAKQVFVEHESQPEKCRNDMPGLLREFNYIELSKASRDIPIDIAKQ